MSRFYQKYLNGLPSKDGEEDNQKNIDPTSMSLSVSTNAGTVGKGTNCVLNLLCFAFRRVILNTIFCYIPFCWRLLFYCSNLAFTKNKNNLFCKSWH